MKISEGDFCYLLFYPSVDPLCANNSGSNIYLKYLTIYSIISCAVYKDECTDLFAGSIKRSFNDTKAIENGD